jgi:hypothetical protein
MKAVEINVVILDTCFTIFVHRLFFKKMKFDFDVSVLWWMPVYNAL